MPLFVLMVVAALVRGSAAELAAGDILVGIVYSAPATVSDSMLRSDVQAIRRAGFNMIVPADVQSRTRVAAAAEDAELHVGVIRAAAAHSRIVVGRGAVAAAEARLAFWTAFASGTRDLAFAAPGHRLTDEIRSLGETAGVVTRNQALFAPLAPKASGVRSVSSGPMGAVQVKLLASADTLVIVALNHAPRARKVTIAFARDIPEAIWQNLESGTAMSFVMTKDGPVLEYTFAPRDALVLMMRKNLR